MVSSGTDEFRAAVAETTGRASIPDAVWEDCFDWVLGERFESGKKVERAGAVKEMALCVREVIKKALAITAEVNAEVETVPAEEITSRRRDSSHPVQEQSAAFFVPLSDYERDRAWAFALEVAALADALYGYRIRRFREEELGGQLLNTGDVEAWYRSPASEPLVKELSRQAGAIARGLPAWSLDDAAYYILTDEPPPIHALRGTFSRARLALREQRGLITIEVEPWVTEQTLRRLYSELRARVLPQHHARHQGMAVWRFVESLHAKPRPTLRDVWRELSAGRRGKAVALRDVWKQWVAAHPDLGSLSLVDAHRHWNEAHRADPKKQYRHYTKFRSALDSGIEHGNTIAWPGYRMLVDRGDTAPQ